MTAVCMIYGATGHTGRMIVDAALARGLRPIVAGRNADQVRALAGRHQLPFRDFSLNDPDAIVAALEDVDVVLNAAGPLGSREDALARACMAAGVHYLDTGCDLRTLETLHALDSEALAAGVTVLGGAGFSPAIAEALALHLKRRLPGAVRLTIALASPARPTAGMIRAGLKMALRPSLALRRGRLKTMRRRLRHFDFGRGLEPCYSLGWGELMAIRRATGVGNVDFFVRARPDISRLLRLFPPVAALRSLPPVRARLDQFAAEYGVRATARRRPGRSRLVGFAYDAGGQRACSRIHLPDPYTVTAEIGAAVLARAMSGPLTTGVQTPAQYLGADFLAALPDLHVDWEELELTAPGDLNLRIRRKGRRFALPFLKKWRRSGMRHSSAEETVGPGPEHAVEVLRAALRAGRTPGPRQSGEASNSAADTGNSGGLMRTGTD